MTYAGARGKTAAQMSRALRFNHLNFNVHPIFRATLGSINAGQGDYVLSVANGLFVDEKYATLPSFKSFVSKYYSAEFNKLEFHNDANASAEYINEWVEGKTNGKITDIVEEHDVEGVNVVLANAIYFNGKWKRPFDHYKTLPVTFYVSPGVESSVEMMVQRARFRYSLNHRLRCEILELPYEGDRLAMYILLPMEKDGLAALESKVTFYAVTSALANMHQRRLSVAIPHFEMTIDNDLPAALKAMGMKLAFTSAADFGKIGAGMYISDVIHKAYVHVDTTGTVAAAATIITGLTALPPGTVHADFLADHPFVFLIRDITTGSILFLGRVVDP